MLDLTGKTALVTGATGGIGRSIAERLHARGATLAISGTRQAVLDEIAAEFGDRVHVLPCDLTDLAAVDGLIGQADEAMGQVDILVNNAGITRDNIFMRMKDDEWDQVIQVNLTAMFRLTRAAVGGMMRRRSGRIISITSVVGTIGNPGQGNYCASKAGMVGMTKSLAFEVASRGITVNCVAPGFISTAMTDALNDKQREAILSRVPSKRLGNPEEVANAVVYLASDEAAYMTGQTLHVNGGMAMI